MPDTVTIKTDWIKIAAAIFVFFSAIGSWTFIAGASYEQFEKQSVMISNLDTQYTAIKEDIQRRQDRATNDKQEIDLALVTLTGKLSLIELRLVAIEKALERLPQR